MSDLTTVFLDNPAPEHTTVITGPTIVGSILNWYFFGVLNVQYVLYLMYSRNDKTTIKMIVHLIFALNTVQTFLMMDDVFFWFVYNFGDANKLLQIRWVFDTPVLDAIVGFIVQAVYCWRIWVLSGWRTISVLTFVVSLLAGASGLASGIRLQTQDSFSLTHGFNAAVMLWLFGSIVVNIVIASSMTYVLVHEKRTDPIRVQTSTTAGVLRLLGLALETNAITAAVMIVTVALFLAKPLAPPKTKFYQLGGSLIGKLYSSCLMVLLTQRYTGHPNDTRIDSNGGGYRSHSGENGLGSRNPAISRAVITRTVTVDDGRSTPSKPREFSGDEAHKSRLSLGV